MYAFDVSDKRKLVGAADNVFVGRVVGKTDGEGAGEAGPGPRGRGSRSRWPRT